MKDRSIFPVLIILLLRALADSKTVCDCPCGAWALPPKIFSRWGEVCTIFFVHVGHGHFLSQSVRSHLPERGVSPVENDWYGSHIFWG